jgi:hypothetical protein
LQLALQNDVTLHAFHRAMLSLFPDHKSLFILIDYASLRIFMEFAVHNRQQKHTAIAEWFLSHIKTIAVGQQGYFVSVRARYYLGGSRERNMNMISQ